MIEDVRNLHILGATGKVRSELYDGREHFVVPVVALMEGVIHAVNAGIPEFVPGERLTAAAHTWNGRALVLGHPTLNGKQISANDPGVLQRQGFGTIFASKTNGTKLGMEAWIDPKRLEVLGQHELLERVKRGDPIEVSVGAFVKTLAKGGSYKGKAYNAEWHEIVGDHLAFLPKGRGACSLEMGCGAHRAAEVYKIEDEELYALSESELEALGGPGSGWTAEAGHVPGSQGGGGGGKRAEKIGGALYGDESRYGKTTEGERHSYASDAHRDAADAHRNAAVGKVSSDAARKATQAAQQLTKGTGTKPYTAQAANAYASMAKGASKTGLSKESSRYHEEAAKYHDSASKWHERAPKYRQAEEGATMKFSPSFLSRAVELLKNAASYGKSAERTEISGADGEGYVEELESEKFLGCYTLKGGKKVEKEFDSKGAAAAFVKKAVGASMKAAAYGDTPSEAASEEAAELIGYQTLQSLLEGLSGCGDEAQSLVQDLIEDETERPTMTSEDEKAESEVECARLEALQTHLMVMSSTIGSLLSLTYKMLLPDLPEPSAPRYMEELRSAIGKEISSKNLKVIQAAHDSSHGMHDHTTALGAQCTSGMKAAAENPCSCGGRSAEGEGNMTRTERITALLKSEHNPLKDQKALEAASDDALKTLETHVENAATLKAAADKKKEEKKDEHAQTPLEIRTAAAKALNMTLEQYDEAEYLKNAPESIRTLVADKKAQDAERHKELIATLKTAADGSFTEDELKAMSLSELEKLARFAKVERVDFSGRGMPRAAQSIDDVYAKPPDPYAAGVAKMRGEKTTA